MLKVDTKALQAQLAKLKIEVTKKLERMVRTFTYETVGQLIDNTPLGDSNVHAEWYNKRTKDRRWQSYGLQPEEGFAQGSWQVLTSSSYVTVPKVERYGPGSGDEARNAASGNLMSYKLGNLVIIGNKGPYIMDLNRGYSNQAPDGIVKPSMTIIRTVYSQQLKQYYDKGAV